MTRQQRETHCFHVGPNQSFWHQLMCTLSILLGSFSLKASTHSWSSAVWRSPQVPHPHLHPELPWPWLLRQDRQMPSLTAAEPQPPPHPEPSDGCRSFPGSDISGPQPLHSSQLPELPADYRSTPFSPVSKQTHACVLPRACWAACRFHPQ